MMKTPFAVLGIRTAGGAVTGIEYLPKTERATALSYRGGSRCKEPYSRVRLAS